MLESLGSFLKIPVPGRNPRPVKLESWVVAEGLFLFEKAVQAFNVHAGLRITSRKRNLKKKKKKSDCLAR